MYEIINCAHLLKGSLVPGYSKLPCQLGQVCETFSWLFACNVTRIVLEITHDLEKAINLNYQPSQNTEFLEKKQASSINVGNNSIFPSQLALLRPIFHVLLWFLVFYNQRFGGGEVM